MTNKRFITAKDVVEEYGYDMEVVKVKTFDDAIRYLRKSNQFLGIKKRSMNNMLR